MTLFIKWVASNTSSGVYCLKRQRLSPLYLCLGSIIFTLLAEKLLVEMISFVFKSMCLFHSGASANKDSNVKVKINLVLLPFPTVFNFLR